MTEHNKNEKKDELLQILSDAKHDAQDLASKGREVVKQGQYAADLALCHEEFIRCVPDDTFFPPSQCKKKLYLTNASTPTGDKAGLIFAQVFTPAGDASRYV